MRVKGKVLIDEIPLTCPECGEDDFYTTDEFRVYECAGCELDVQVLTLDDIKKD